MLSSISCLLMVAPAPPATSAQIAVWAACLLFVPETPAYFISQGQDVAAREALEWLRGTNRVDQEFYLIKRSLDESSQLSAGPKDLVSRYVRLCYVSLRTCLVQPKPGPFPSLHVADVGAAVQRNERRHVLLCANFPGWFTLLFPLCNPNPRRPAAVSTPTWRTS